MNYLIKFITKRDLRLLLRYNYKQKIIHSSLYKIADFYYILLQVSNSLQFPKNINVQPICTVKPDGAISSTTKGLSITQAEEYLLGWAQSEILQSVNYIQFEQNSILSNHSRMVNCFDMLVYRCFESLVDVFAVLNYTPDSFSDGGKFNQIDSALTQIERLCHMGASIIDLGVQSTRPKAEILDAGEEIRLLKKILPHILELKSKLKFALSIDTYHSETVLWLADFSIDIINDVSGSLSLDVVKPILNSGKRYVAMHSLCIPANPKMVLNDDINPVDHLYAWMNAKLEALANASCDVSNLILDPGIGFGLTAAQSWFVVRHIAKLRELPCEILAGHSRKSFFSHITAETASNRDLETAIVAANILPYVDYVRLHELELFNRSNSVFNQICHSHADGNPLLI